MITRRRKLIAAGIVLAVGFGLAWPLRRTEPLLPTSARLASTPIDPQRLTEAVNLDQQSSQAAPIPSGPVASTASMPAASGRDPFADAAPPVYSTISAGPNNTAPLREVPSDELIHVVHEGDSLDRLAKRYLGDEARALEIFDLNRKVLENPHVLPLRAELRIPSGSPVVDD